MIVYVQLKLLANISLYKSESEFGCYKHDKVDYFMTYYIIGIQS